MQQAIDFFSNGFFTVMGGVSSILFMFSIIIVVLQCVKGLFPVLWRLGRALNGRTIAFYVQDETGGDIRSLLEDSGVFKKKRIKVIVPSAADSGDKYSLHLVHYSSCRSCLADILKNVKSSHALVIYAPQNEGTIPQKDLEEINKKRNVFVVNFKGRLLNDLVSAMITTSFPAK